MTFLGVPIAAMGVFFWTSPIYLAVQSVFPNPYWQLYFMATSLGTGVVMSQFIGKRYGEIIEESKNSSTGLIESTVVSIAYFTLITTTGAGIGLIAVFFGYPTIGLAAAFLIGGLDLLFAEKFDFSVLTLPFG